MTNQTTQLTIIALIALLLGLALGTLLGSHQFVTDTNRTAAEISTYRQTNPLPLPPAAPPVQ